MKMFALWAGGLAFVVAVAFVATEIAGDKWAPGAWIPTVIAFAVVVGTLLYLGRD